MLLSKVSSTMWKMKDVIDLLKKEGIREDVKVMVGGGPVTETFAKEIGADAYSNTAIEAVSIAKKLVNM